MRPIRPRIFFAFYGFFTVASPNLIFPGEAALPTVCYAVTGHTSVDWPWFGDYIDYTIIDDAKKELGIR